jgi:hypothetical protein
MLAAYVGASRKDVMMLEDEEERAVLVQEMANTILESSLPNASMKKKFHLAAG